MNNQDTICAISTAAGQGAIAVVRLSGEESIPIGDKVFKAKSKKLAACAANTLHYGTIEYKGKLLDDVVCAIFKAPHSYTGEDIVEISCHGSVYIQQKLLECLVSLGARLAKPGEFTQRAFLNGKMDLSQAEGVADLIASGSDAAHRLAINQMRGGFSVEINKLRTELLNFVSLIELELDFSEEDVEFADRTQLTQLIQRIETMLTRLISSFEYGNAVKNGIPVAIVGRTNAGKSTLLNQLLKEDKAIVSDIAGTTRDFLEDTIVLSGIQFRFIDTAGLRHTSDRIETEGIQRTLKKYEQASIVIVMIDPDDTISSLEESLRFIDTYSPENSGKHIIMALNKTDLITSTQIKYKIQELRIKWPKVKHIMALSAKEGTGLDTLEELLISEAGIKNVASQDVVVTNVRHFEALKHSETALQRVKEGMVNQLPSDLLAQDIREILHYLGEITGEISTDEILGNIFHNFCIGK